MPDKNDFTAETQRKTIYAKNFFTLNDSKVSYSNDTKRLVERNLSISTTLRSGWPQ